ncbi:MAG TPA: hypothetical protein VLH38_03235 [Patescibacteria group bacterium]|nr:hypothetical protein [Patescibacteria group bacterium]
MAENLIGDIGLNNMANFVPETPEVTDRVVAPAIAESLLLKGTVEPFGTNLAVEASPISNDKGTAGPTGPKATGGYDDAKTFSE